MPDSRSSCRRSGACTRARTRKARRVGRPRAGQTQTWLVADRQQRRGSAEEECSTSSRLHPAGDPFPFRFQVPDTARVSAPSIDVGGGAVSGTARARNFFHEPPAGTAGRKNYRARHLAGLALHRGALLRSGTRGVPRSHLHAVATPPAAQDQGGPRTTEEDPPMASDSATKAGGASRMRDEVNAAVR